MGDWTRPWAVMLGATLLAACTPAPPSDHVASVAPTASVDDDTGAVVLETLEVSESLPLTVRTLVVAREVTMSSVGASCAGHTSARPALRLSADEAVSLNLEVSVESPPMGWSIALCQQGECRCDVASRGPVARLHATMQPGEADVYVGGRGGDGVEVALAMWPGPPSEAPGIVTLGGGGLPPVVEEGVPPTLTEQGTYGGARLDANTGPARLTGTAGGARDASVIGVRCRGDIAEAPDHVVELAAAMDLVWRVEATVDTTLVVVGPDEATWCSDDVNGLNPALEGHYEAGTYHVYVGTLGHVPEAPPHTLTVSR